MYIDHVFYLNYYPKNIDKKMIARDRFSNYFNELHDRYHFPLDLKSIQSFSYLHHELGHDLFNTLQNKININECDYIIFPSWGVPFDPDYATHELHYKFKFNLKPEIIDVKDCGSLCVYHAIDLIFQLLHFESNQKILCCSIETAGSPSCNQNILSHPEVNFISAIQINNKNLDLKHIQLIHIMLNVNKSTSDIGNLLSDMLNQYKIQPNECIAFIKEKTNLFKLAEMQFEYLSVIFKIKWHSIAHLTSSGFLCYCLFHLFSLTQKNINPYILIIDEDVESSAIGIILLKIGNQ